MRLVHYTLQEYLEVNQKQIFPNMQHHTAEICLTYLSYDDFGRKDFILPFAGYAVLYWADHLRGFQQELKVQALAFIEDTAKTSTWITYYRPNMLLPVDLFFDDDSSIPVHIAAFWGLTVLLSTLLTPNNIEAENIDGQTPLFHAANEGHVDVLNLLLERKANVHAKDTRSGRTALCKAVERGHHGIVVTLLEHGADVDTQTASGTTPLHLVAGKNLNTVGLFLERGAEVDVLSGKYRTARHAATRVGIGASVRNPFDHGAPLEIKDDNGSNSLHRVAERAPDPKAETLLALLNGGARLDSRDGMGRNPLHMIVDANQDGDHLKIFLQEEQRRRSSQVSLR